MENNNIRRVSGHGYAYSIDHAYQGQGRYRVTLWHCGERVIITDSYDEATRLGEAFAHACNQYWKVQRIAAIHAQGFYTLGS